MTILPSGWIRTYDAKAPYVHVETGMTAMSIRNIPRSISSSIIPTASQKVDAPASVPTPVTEGDDPDVLLAQANALETLVQSIEHNLDTKMRLLESKLHRLTDKVRSLPLSLPLPPYLRLLKRRRKRVSD